MAASISCVRPKANTGTNTPPDSKPSRMAVMNRCSSASRVNPAGISVAPRVVSRINTSDCVPEKSAFGESV